MTYTDHDVKYNVIGCQGTEEATLLHSSSTQYEAIDWVEARRGNFEGYDEIRVVRLSHNDVVYAVREETYTDRTNDMSDDTAPERIWTYRWHQYTTRHISSDQVEYVRADLGSLKNRIAELEAEREARLEAAAAAIAYAAGV